ncbi:MAG TPA: nucleoside transporter C-terminal domain-containing protein [Tepidisphaeraceae bacterium]|nr:nucleoside transporter C-terminal domain-containing protein [Tepidisphaeraceae bacterium]
MSSLLFIAQSIPHGTLGERAQSLFGLFVFLLIALAFGKIWRTNGSTRVPFPWRVVIWGFILQFVFASLVLFSPGVLVTVQNAINKLLDYSNAGSKLIFGETLVSGTSVRAADGSIIKIGQVFAFFVLPTIVFVSMLTAILYHIGVLKIVVHGFAWIMRKTTGTSGAETLSAAANILVGQTEAPLFVRPFLERATKSELMAIMVGGFANIASGVLVIYSGLLEKFVPNAGGHLAAACLVSAPATLVVSKLMLPEVDVPETKFGSFKIKNPDANVLDAATRGTSEGMYLAFNVGAMLVAFTALVAMLNSIVGWIGGWFGFEASTLQNMFGYFFAPLMWLTGAPWSDCDQLGSWMAIKTVLNEFVAYISMSESLTANPSTVSPRSALLATYALCGFANFASIGIQIGGIGTLIPSRRAELSRIALPAMIGGALASLMGACVIGVLI